MPSCLLMPRKLVFALWDEAFRHRVSAQPKGILLASRPLRGRRLLVHSLRVSENQKRGRKHYRCPHLITLHRSRQSKKSISLRGHS
jgi:hypothetical protein